MRFPHGAAGEFGWGGRGVRRGGRAAGPRNQSHGEFAASLRGLRGLAVRVFWKVTPFSAEFVPRWHPVQRWDAL